jgi:branched-chain amino acid aminotransferase
LPGVTRQSVLDLARLHNLPPLDPQHALLPFPDISSDFGVSPSTKVHPVERVITIEQLSKHNDAGEVLELFGAGTAAVVCPIGRIGYKHKDIIFPTFSPDERPELAELGGYGVVSKAMLTALEDIYTGVRKSDWSVRCE